MANDGIMEDGVWPHDPVMPLPALEGRRVWAGGAHGSMIYGCGSHCWQWERGVQWHQSKKLVLGYVTDMCKESTWS